MKTTKFKMPVDTKLYDLLGVEPSASTNEIKKQFRRLARQYHPDKAGAEHEEKFKEISYAHEILTDDKKRDLYDRYGEKGLVEGGMSAGMEDLLGHIFGHGSGMGGGMGGFDSMFGFGPFGMGGGGRRRQQRRRGEDTVHPLRVKLEDLYMGKVSKLKLRKKIICSQCDGVGGKGNAVQKCYSCNGNGIKISIQPIGPGMVQQVQKVCPDCQGEGEVIDAKNRCKKCNGKKVVEETKILEVHVNRGMMDGERITFRGEGDQQPGVETGNVVIVIQQLPHEQFVRKGDNLNMKLKIGLTEAICGFKIPIKHLDGREILISNPVGKVIEPGSTKFIMDEGMPRHRDPTEKGHLFIEFDVIFPDNEFLDDEGLKKLEKLLPPRPEIMDIPDSDALVFDCPLIDLDKSNHDTGSYRDAYNESDDDEDGMHGHGGPGVQCATQ